MSDNNQKIQKIKKKLDNFKNAKEWSDFISLLTDVDNALKKVENIPKEIEFLLTKRLNQSIHPALPAGVHNKALQTYELIISRMKLSDHLTLGLFSYGIYSKLSVRKNYFCVLEKLKDKPVKSCSYILGILPFLEEENGEYFEPASRLIATQDDETSLWKNFLYCPELRIPVINYFKTRPVTISKILIKSIHRALYDGDSLTVRGTLDLLNKNVPLHDLIKYLNPGITEFEYESVTRILPTDLPSQSETVLTATQDLTTEKDKHQANQLEEEKKRILMRDEYLHADLVKLTTQILMLYLKKEVTINKKVNCWLQHDRILQRKILERIIDQDLDLFYKLFQNLIEQEELGDKDIIDLLLYAMYKTRKKSKGFDIVYSLLENSFFWKMVYVEIRRVINNHRFSDKITESKDCERSKEKVNKTGNKPMETKTGNKPIETFENSEIQPKETFEKTDSKTEIKATEVPEENKIEPKKINRNANLKNKNKEQPHEKDRPIDELNHTHPDNQSINLLKEAIAEEKKNTINAVLGEQLPEKLIIDQQQSKLDIEAVDTSETQNEPEGTQMGGEGHSMEDGTGMEHKGVENEQGRMEDGSIKCTDSKQSTSKNQYTESEQCTDSNQCFNSCKCSDSKCTINSKCTIEHSPANRNGHSTELKGASAKHSGVDPDNSVTDTAHTDTQTKHSGGNPAQSLPSALHEYTRTTPSDTSPDMILSLLCFLFSETRTDQEHSSHALNMLLIVSANHTMFDTRMVNECVRMLIRTVDMGMAQEWIENGIRELIDNRTGVSGKQVIVEKGQTAVRKGDCANEESGNQGDKQGGNQSGNQGGKKSDTQSDKQSILQGEHSTVRRGQWVSGKKQSGKQSIVQGEHSIVGYSTDGKQDGEHSINRHSTGDTSRTEQHSRDKQVPDRQILLNRETLNRIDQMLDSHYIRGTPLVPMMIFPDTLPLDRETLHLIVSHVDPFSVPFWHRFIVERDLHQNYFILRNVLGGLPGLKRTLFRRLFYEYDERLFCAYEQVYTRGFEELMIEEIREQQIRGYVGRDFVREGGQYEGKYGGREEYGQYKDKQYERGYHNRECNNEQCKDKQYNNEQYKDKQYQNNEYEQFLNNNEYEQFLNKQYDQHYSSNTLTDRHLICLRILDYSLNVLNTTRFYRTLHILSNSPIHHFLSTLRSIQLFDHLLDHCDIFLIEKLVKYNHRFIRHIRRGNRIMEGLLPLLRECSSRVGHLPVGECLPVREYSVGDYSVEKHLPPRNNQSKEDCPVRDYSVKKDYSVGEYSLPVGEYSLPPKKRDYARRPDYTRVINILKALLSLNLIPPFDYQGLYRTATLPFLYDTLELIEHVLQDTDSHTFFKQTLPLNHFIFRIKNREFNKQMYLEVINRYVGIIKEQHTSHVQPGEYVQHTSHIWPGDNTRGRDTPGTKHMDGEHHTIHNQNTDHVQPIRPTRIDLFLLLETLKRIFKRRAEFNIETVIDRSLLICSQVSVHCYSCTNHDIDRNTSRSTDHDIDRITNPTIYNHHIMNNHLNHYDTYPTNTVLVQIFDILLLDPCFITHYMKYFTMRLPLNERLNRRIFLEILLKGKYGYINRAFSTLNGHSTPSNDIIGCANEPTMGRDRTTFYPAPVVHYFNYFFNDRIVHMRKIETVSQLCFLMSNMNEEYYSHRLIEMCLTFLYKLLQNRKMVGTSTISMCLYNCGLQLIEKIRGNILGICLFILRKEGELLIEIEKRGTGVCVPVWDCPETGCVISSDINTGGDRTNTVSNNNGNSSRTNTVSNNNGNSSRTNTVSNNRGDSARTNTVSNNRGDSARTNTDNINTDNSARTNTDNINTYNSARTNTDNINTDNSASTTGDNTGNVCDCPSCCGPRALVLDALLYHRIGVKEFFDWYMDSSVFEGMAACVLSRMAAVLGQCPAERVFDLVGKLAMSGGIFTNAETLCQNNVEVLRKISFFIFAGGDGVFNTYITLIVPWINDLIVTSKSVRKEVFNLISIIFLRCDHSHLFSLFPIYSAEIGNNTFLEVLRSMEILMLISSKESVELRWHMSEGDSLFKKKLDEIYPGTVTRMYRKELPRRRELLLREDKREFLIRVESYYEQLDREIWEIDSRSVNRVILDWFRIE